MKRKEIQWGFTSDRNPTIHETFDTKKEMLDEINDVALGKKFSIYKITIKKELIKTINKKRPRPCYGGWRKGHSTGFEYKPPEKGVYPQSVFCKSCGYRLKLIYRDITEPAYILDKPLVHKDDEPDNR